MGRLEGKVALITGAASGIGAACARRFSEEGAKIGALDLQKAEGALWSAEVDVRDEEAVRQAVGAAVAALGRIDALVNAAGVSGFGSAHELALAEFERILDINLKGTFLVSKHVIPIMLEKGSGSIIHLASIEGLIGMNGQLAYNASKGAVVLMTKSMALDYGRQGIRVNCICPGAIETPMTAVLDEEALRPLKRQMAELHALGRFGRPEEIAHAALFLASDEASFVTGSSLVVDGGFTAGHRLTLDTA